MKILLLSHSFYPNIGGIETVSMILAEQFVLAGHSVCVLTRTAAHDTENFQFEIIRSPSVKQIFECIYRADVLLENNLCLSLSWPALLFSKPTVIALHTWISRPDGSLSFIDRLKKLKLYTSSDVVVVSGVLKNSINVSSVIIHNPFKGDTGDLSESGEPQYDFVYLGRLVSDKGVDLAIDAIAKLLSENIKCTLTIIGDGPEMDTLKQRVADHNILLKVFFKGNLVGKRLFSELRNHKYLLVPSRWREPFGIVALEGLACGCIPIVADGGGLPDAVGNAGLVFRRGDLNDLINKMKLILNDKKLNSLLKEAAFNHISKHEPELIAKRYLDVLQQCAEAGNRRD